MLGLGHKPKSSAERGNKMAIHTYNAEVEGCSTCGKKFINIEYGQDETCDTCFEKAMVEHEEFIAEGNWGR
jgi:hypothetical protein